MEEKAKLTTGQRLWYRNKKSGKVGYVVVDQIHEDDFYFYFDGKQYTLSLDVIGTRLYLSPHDLMKVLSQDESGGKITTVYAEKWEYTGRLPEKMEWIQKDVPVPRVEAYQPVYSPPPPPNRTPACEICALRKNGTCGSLSNQLCEDYRPTQYISKEEMESFPEFGDATAFRLNKWRR